MNNSIEPTKNAKGPNCNPEKFANLEPDAFAFLTKNSRPISAPLGSVIFQPGKTCTDFLWLSKGRLRVQMVGANGREIVLYRVTPGNSCVMTTSCLLSGDEYNAEAIVEEDVTGIAIGKSAFNQLLAISPNFRETIFASFGNRIGELMRYIEDVSFSRLDQRLASYVCEHAIDNQLAITHEALARELATHREAVSRILKELERKGWIKLGHGKIKLLDIPALSAIKRGE